jgi:tetratricopeptide (TPR) repeat protein
MKFAEKKDLAEKLLQQGIESQRVLPQCYVLLREARELAASIGEVDTALRAIDEMHRRFDVPALELAASALDKASKVATASNAKPIVEACLVQADACIEDDLYELAEKILKSGETAAKKLNTNTGIPARVQTKLKETAELAKEFKAAKAAMDALKKNPDNAEANLKAGRFLALLKGNWPEGLPLLAKGSDVKLRELAERDEDQPADAKEQVEIGDGWYSLGKSATGLASIEMLARAKFWYDKAMPELEGLGKARIAGRLKEIEKVLPTEDVTLVTGDKPKGNPKVEFDKRMAAGVKMAQQLRFGDALALFSQALEIAADNPQMVETATKYRDYAQHMVNGGEALRQNDFQKAREEFEAALDLAPNDPAAKQGRELARREGRSERPPRGGPPFKWKK